MEINGLRIEPGADLQDANLRGAHLQVANLRGAHLEYAHMQNSNLWGANLQGAHLQKASLWGAYLQDANLRGADLRGANLEDANLQDANLQHANLRDADLRGANLRGAELQGAKSIWLHHGVIAEILRQAAGEDLMKRATAGLILVSPDWCWQEFLALDWPLRGWAIETLRFWRDGNEPLEVRNAEAEATVAHQVYGLAHSALRHADDAVESAEFAAANPK